MWGEVGNRKRLVSLALNQFSSSMKRRVNILTLFPCLRVVYPYSVSGIGSCLLGEAGKGKGKISPQESRTGITHHRFPQETVLIQFMVSDVPKILPEQVCGGSKE